MQGKLVMVCVCRPLFYSNDSARKRKLDELVMNMIAVDIQPFSCVEVADLSWNFSSMKRTVMVK